MKIRPPATVGCPNADAPLGNPNAHFSFSLGTSSAVRRAAAAGWKRELPGSALHPFHDGPVSGFSSGLAAQWFFIADAWPACAAPSGRSVMYSASIRFCASSNPSALTAIEPVVMASRIASGVRARSDSRVGVRSSAGLVWHTPQRASKRPSARIACADARVGTTSPAEHRSTHLTRRLIMAA
jgi:hypothetical protein